MLSALLLYTMAGPLRQSSPLPGQGLTGESLKLFRQVVAQPTGSNGYEDYVEAASLLLSPEHVAFQKWRAYWSLSAGGSQPVLSEGKSGLPEPEPQAPPGLTLRSSAFEVRQAYVKRFAPILEIVRRGNTKRVYQPRSSMDFETLLPELAQFKNLARLAQEKAYAEFAAGSPSSATDALIESLKFAANFAEGPTIHFLVSIASQSIAIQGFEFGLGRLALADVNAVVKACTDLLGRPVSAAVSADQEFAFLEAGLDKVVENLRSEHLIGDDETADLVEQISALNAADRRGLLGVARDLLASKRQECSSIFQLPESQWHRRAISPHPISPQDRATVAGLAARLANSVTPAISQPLSAFARSRAQLRILRLTARVIAYRWKHDRLPDSLSAAAPDGELADPASGREFKYERLPRGVFRVYSEGFGDLGPIDLVYRRPSSPPVRDRDPLEPPEVDRSLKRLAPSRPLPN